MFQKIKKPLVIVIVLSLLLPSFYLLSVQPSKATDGGGAWAKFWQDQLINFVLKPLMRRIAQQLLTTYVNKMVDQINNNGRTKNSPGFVDIWRNFLTEAQYRGEDVFRNILANTSLCGHVAPGIRSTFKTKAPQPLTQNIRVGNLDPFTLRARCTLPQGWAIESFKADFSGNGGWEALVRLAEPQNNSFGSLLLSIGELAAQRTLDETTDKIEVQAGRGFMGTRSSCTLAATCKNNVCSNGIGPCLNDNQCAEIGTTARCSFLGQTLTPAEVIGNASTKFIDTKLDFVINSHDVVTVILNAITGIVNNLTNFRKVPPKDNSVLGGSADAYQVCIRSCAGKSGDTYRACMEDCANKVEPTTPGSYDFDNPPGGGPTPSPSPLPTPTPTPIPPVPGDDVLSPGESISIGGYIKSANGEYQLDLQAADGNLVLYRLSDGVAIWNAGVGGLGGVQLDMQQVDGNLVLYNSAGTGIWSSGTGGSPNAYLVVQNGGNIVIYAVAGTPALWWRP